MSTTTSTDARKHFRQAIRTFQSVLKTGVEIQEESTKWLAEMLDGLDSTEAWQAGNVTLMDEAVAANQANVDEAIRHMKRNAAASLELLQTAFDAGLYESSPDADFRIQELWETLQEVGHIMGVTRTLIRQLQSHALGKLRKEGREAEVECPTCWTAAEPVVLTGKGNGRFRLQG